MKKYILVALLFVPMVSMAAPSVRILGNNQASSAATAAGVKITPAKATVSNIDSVTTPARLGTLRTKTTNNTTGAISGTNTRFPVITSAKVYGNVTPPKQNAPVNNNTTIISGDVDVDAIVNAVTNRVQEDFYNKSQVDTKVTQVDTRVDQVDVRIEELDQRIDQVTDNLNDPKFDAIRLVNPREARGVDAPTGYAYIWIEE